MKLFALFVVSFCAVRASAAVPALPADVAEDALKTLKMVAVSDPQNFGFSSQAEVNAAALGPSLREYFVGLDDLAAYRKGQDPFSIMQFGDHTQVVLVEVGGTARCMILFRYYQTPAGSASPVAGAWRMAEMGSPNIAEDIEVVLQKFKGLADNDAYLVEAPAMGVMFIGARAARQRSAGQAYALYDDATLGLKAGQSKSVEDVFASLQPGAANKNRHPANGPGGPGGRPQHP